MTNDEIKSITDLREEVRLANRENKVRMRILAIMIGLAFPVLTGTVAWGFSFLMDLQDEVQINTLLHKGNPVLNSRLTRLETLMENQSRDMEDIKEALLKRK